MKALILAAGYATRLYPLTKEYPKPLLEVGARPMIDHILDKLAVIDDVDEIVVVTNSKFFPMFEEWANGARLRIPRKKITVVDDGTKGLDDRLGAIGDIRFAIDHGQLCDDLLVVGGDNLFQDDLSGFVAQGKSKPMPVIGVHDIERLEQASRYGVVKIDRDNIIVDFQEKPEHPESTLVAMCLYYFPKGKLQRVREYLDSKTNKKDATGYYIGWLTRREKVVAFIFHGHWYDIGHHEVYNKAKERYGDGNA